MGELIEIGYIYLTHYGQSRLDGYIFLGLDHFDAKGDGKPCGRSFINRNYRCSDGKKAQLAADLKAGDAGAKKRVEQAKKNQRERNELKREVARDKGKKAKVVEKVEKQTTSKTQMPFEVNGKVAGPKKLPDKVTEEQMLKLQSPTHTGRELGAKNDAVMYNKLGDSAKEKAFKRSLLIPRVYGGNNDSSSDRVKFLHEFDKQETYSDKDVNRFAEIFPQSMEGWEGGALGALKDQVVGKIDHPTAIAGAEYGASIYSRLNDQQKDEFVLQSGSTQRKLKNLKAKSEEVEKFNNDYQSRYRRLQSKGISDVEFYRLTGGQGNDYEEPDIDFGDDDDDLDLRL